MRRLEHLAYTPAPDIVHEAAGHAPIIADPAYARYLKQYGEISRKAISSDQDWEVYSSIRYLSDLKENPESAPKDIVLAERRCEEALAGVDYLSEAALLTRMNWWTIEYGLVGKEPLIYGAGLLSSVGESYHCLDDTVKKIPLTLDCINVNYDITKQQPQLFVAPDFESLSRILDELSQTMAYRRGGLESLEKAKKAATLTTCVFDDGLQVSGKLVDIETDAGGNPRSLKWEGPIQLSKNDHELPGKGPIDLPNGYQMALKTYQKIISVFGGAADRTHYLEAAGSHQISCKPKTNLTEGNRELNKLYQEVRDIRDSLRVSSNSGDRIRKVFNALESHYPDEWLSL